jgi:hypothetical protein
MTLNRRLLLALPVLCGLTITMPAHVNAEFGPKPDLAAALYDRGEHSNAYREYLKLAKDGESFAQYRVSYMLAMGLGTDADPVDSLAWAVVAATSAEGELDSYQEAIAASVPSKARKKAQKRVDYFLRRWGTGQYSKSGNTLAWSSEGGCTGSRLAGNCGKGSSGSSYWIAWDEDRSNDPAQRELIRKINDFILESPNG